MQSVLPLKFKVPNILLLQILGEVENNQLLINVFKISVNSMTLVPSCEKKKQKKEKNKMKEGKRENIYILFYIYFLLYMEKGKAVNHRVSKYV